MKTAEEYLNENRKRINVDGQGRLSLIDCFLMMEEFHQEQLSKMKVSDTLIKELFDKYGHLLPDVQDEYLMREQLSKWDNVSEIRNTEIVDKSLEHKSQWLPNADNEPLSGFSFREGAKWMQQHLNTQEESKWVDASLHEPDDARNVLIMLQDKNGYTEVYICYHTSNGWYFSNGDKVSGKVLFFMGIPNPPLDTNN